MNHLICGTFDDAVAANKAVERIIAMEYPRDQITIIMSTQTRYRFWDQSKTHDRPPTNADNGGVKGETNRDVIGAIIAANDVGHLAAGTGDTATRLFIAGPAAAAPTNEGSNPKKPPAVLRTLSGLGMPRFDAERLERDIDSGAIVVGVITHTGDRMSMERAMETNSARNVVETLTT